MTDHLPECPWADRGFAFPCICDRLRACEQRVRDEDQRILIKHGAEQFVRGERIGKAMGHAAGVQAARDAVARKAERGPLYSVRNSGSAQYGFDAMARHALAAIDALRDTPTRINMEDPL
jgi:hypothetical protein